MGYQVLARKWRPRSFETLVGQEHVVRALEHALDQQRLHHAYLFSGTRGVGKTTLARILAKALNCETGVSSRPCGSCSACLEIDAGRFVDYIELDAASNRGVEDMTSLLEKASYAPTRGRFKVYVIDEVHQLSGHAFNAMLKTLEEPPEHVKFILATTDPQKIPVTVLSRCLQFNLKQMADGQIVGHLARILEAEQLPCEPAALRHLAKGAAGSMRDALSLLDQAIAHGAGRIEEAGVRDMLGTVGDEHLFLLLDAIAARDAQSLVAIAAEMDARSLSFDSALQELATLLHRVALVQLAPAAIADEVERARLSGYAGRLDAEYIQLCYQIVINGRADLALAPDEYAGFVMTLLRLVAFHPETPPALAAGMPEAPAAAAPPRPAAVKTARAAAPEASATAAVAAEAQPPGLDGDDDWHGLLERLKLGGMVRELAQHCQLAGRDENAIRLHLDPAHRQLLMNKGLQEKLQAALAADFGRPLKLVIDIAEPAAETPAQRAQKARAERQNRAIAALEQDAFVRDMIETFDATISEQSIKPLN
ncbi:MAG TPA: DNA polymerase III subunit gamma/tau [Candidatus Desulfobacillus sp.]|nr:DNA polymerase III subunit gamma/tau [Candidatus Desulfobacillus sp.]